MNSLLQPPFTDNEPTLGLGKNPKSLKSLAEFVLKQGSDELNEYSGESTGKQESSKQSSTFKHDYQKGLLEGGQSSSIHSLTMGSLLPLKGQDLLKHETISQPDVPKQSSTCKHDYQKGLLEGQSSSIPSLTIGLLHPLKGDEDLLKFETISQPNVPKDSPIRMECLLEGQISPIDPFTIGSPLPLKGQDLLKLMTISQPDVPKISSLKDILMLRRALHIRYLSLAITTYKYTGRLTSDVSIEHDSTNNKFTVVSSYKHSWLLEPLQRDLNNLSEQPEFKVTETDFLRDVIERTNYYVMSKDLELSSLEEIVLLNYMSIMKIRKWEKTNQILFFDTDTGPLIMDISMEKKIHEAFVEEHKGLLEETRQPYRHIPIYIHYLIRMLNRQHYDGYMPEYQLNRIKFTLFHDVMTFMDNLENLKAAQLMLLLLDQISIKLFISKYTVHSNTYLEFMEVLHS